SLSSARRPLPLASSPTRRSSDLTISSLMTPPASAPSGQARALGVALGDLPAPGFRFKPANPPAAPRVANTIGDVIQDRSKAEARSEEHTSELHLLTNLLCPLLLA